MRKSETTVESEHSEGVDGRTLLSLLGKAHTLAILNEIVLGDDKPVRFGEIQDEVGVSPNTLSRRLDELVEDGFLERTQYDEIPPRVEYESTEILDELEPTFQELGIWLEQYGSEDNECPE